MPAAAKRRREERGDGNGDGIVFGAAQANAYLNARRMRGAGKRKAKTKPPRDAAEAREDAATNAPSADVLAVLPTGDAIEMLREIDASEDEWRRQKGERAFPEHAHLFPVWKSQLHAGCNVLVTGVGSKLALLQTFAKDLPPHAFVVDVMGFLPDVDLRYVLNVLRLEVFEMPASTTSKSIAHDCRDITDYSFQERARNFPHAYLIVHQLDGRALRSRDIQAGLARLATSPFIHIIASADNINTPMLWTQEDLQRFRWVKHFVDTERPYQREVLPQIQRDTRSSVASTSGVNYILMSLTPTDVATIQIIARQQLVGDASASASARQSVSRRGSKQATQLVDSHQVLLECRKNLVHSTLQSMKNTLSVLEDAGLVKITRVKTAETLRIPLPEDVIRSEILAYQANAAS